MKSIELREKALRIAHEARDLIPTIAEDGNNAAEVNAKFDKMMAESDELEARATRLDAIEAREKAYSQIVTEIPASTTVVEGRGAVDAKEVAEQAFNSYLRGEIGDRELRAQVVGTAATGGNLVPSTFRAELIRALKAFGPMNDASIVNYLNTDSGEIIVMPTYDDTANLGAIVAEGAAIGDADDLQFGQTNLGAHKYTTKIVKVSSELLNDTAIPIVPVITSALSERLGRVFNQHLTTGTGSGQPQGIVTGSSLGKTTATATAIAYADLIDLEHSVDAAYRSQGAYMWNDSTFAALRKLLDSQGRPLWQPSMQAGVASTFNGRTYHINTDMASIATGARTVLFGDYKKFTVRVVNDLVVRRLDELYAGNDMVGFVGFLRLDAKVLDTRAIKHLKMA